MEKYKIRIIQQRNVLAKSMERVRKQTWHQEGVNKDNIEQAGRLSIWTNPSNLEIRLIRVSYRIK